MLIPTAAEEEPGHIHSTAAVPRITGVTRRSMLTASMAIAGAAFTGGVAPAFGQKTALRRTAEDALGPFFPLTVPADQDADLTVVSGKDGRALGQLLYVSGRVVNTRGEPVADAMLEIWQANAVGRYAHPGDDSKPALDPNFQGYAKLRTGADGSYRFKTINPGAYADRTRHIHFDARGRNSRLITQMYFEGEPLNERDPLLKLRSPEARKTLISQSVAPTGTQERDALAVAWDIVLASG